MVQTKGKLYKIERPPTYKGKGELVIGVEFWDEPETEHTHGFKGMCYLTPPDRGHMIRGEFKSGDSDAFVFTATQAFPGDWKVKRITKENFITECERIVVGSHTIDEECKTTEELEKWFNSRFL